MFIRELVGTARRLSSYSCPPSVPHALEESAVRDIQTPGSLSAQEKYKFTGSKMNIQCSECGKNLAEVAEGNGLKFFLDGQAVHLVLEIPDMRQSGACFSVMFKNVPEGKGPSDENPYASVSHVCCANREKGKICGKKVGAVKCMPPHSDRKFIFFAYKSLLVDGVKFRSWREARESSSFNVLEILPHSWDDLGMRFSPQARLPLAKSLEAAKIRTADREEPLNETGEGLTKTPPRPYQSELYRMAIRTERNSLVYLPTGLGKTLVATMAMQCLLRWNPERLAVFLVETNALAIMQAGRLRDETNLPVEMLVGATLAKTNKEHGNTKLLEVRSAKIIVATAGAFEHAMCKGFLDPDSFCCVVLDEAHHCSNEHPFHRVVRTFLLPRGSAVDSQDDAAGSSRRPSQPEHRFPKIIALSASPTGGLTVEATVVKLEELLTRLGADLVAPYETIEEVKERSPDVQLELIGVLVTPEEKELLRCLEILVLGRIAKLVHPETDVGIQAQALLARARKRAKVEESESESAEIGSEMSTCSPLDENWQFPNKAHVVLLHQAIQSWITSRSIRCGRSGGSSAPPCIGSYLGSNMQGKPEADTGAGRAIVARGGGDEILHHHDGVGELINLAFAVDDLGGRTTWRWVLDELKREQDLEVPYPGSGRRDVDRDRTIKVLEAHLPKEDCTSDSEEETVDSASGEETPGDDFAEGPEGSKLKMIASLLVEHKRRCDDAGTRFSALIFVSTRRMATATPDLLEAMPEVKEFVFADSIVGQTEMTLAQQNVSLAHFRDGNVNVLVSTSICGEGIDIPSCGLVICTSLPNSHTALIQLRGRLRCGVNSRFVGLRRTCGSADQKHLKTLCTREANMLEAIELLSETSEKATKAHDASKGTQPSAVEVPHSTGKGHKGHKGHTGQGTQGIRANLRDGSSTSAKLSPPSSSAPASATQSDKLQQKARSSDATGSTLRARAARQEEKADCDANEALGTSGWENDMAPMLGAPARCYALAFLGTTTRRTVQKHAGKHQMARSTLNSAIQLAPALKPVVEYEDRRLPGPDHTPCFESRCVLSSGIEGKAGIVLAKQAQGRSIRTAREAAAAKLVQALEAQPPVDFQTVTVGYRPAQEAHSAS